jgi:hypothetical protein
MELVRIVRHQSGRTFCGLLFELLKVRERERTVARVKEGLFRCLPREHKCLVEK